MGEDCTTAETSALSLDDGYVTHEELRDRIENVAKKIDRINTMVYNLQYNISRRNYRSYCDCKDCNLKKLISSWTSRGSVCQKLAHPNRPLELFDFMY